MVPRSPGHSTLIVLVRTPKFRTGSVRRCTFGRGAKAGIQAIGDAIVSETLE